MKKSFYLEPLGCAKNQVDGEIISSRLLDLGWIQSDSPQDAGVILVNTCGFIQPAKEESINTTFELIQDHPQVPVIMAGCLAQRYGSQLMDQMPELAGVFGNHQVEAIGHYLENLLPQGTKVYLPDPAYGSQKSDGSDRRRRVLQGFPGSAYLKIAEGCQHRCSFCAIPLIRGKLRSYTIEAVVQEFRQLLSMGVKEINLIAQDLGSFGKDRGEPQLEHLLRGLLKEADDFFGATGINDQKSPNLWIRPLYLYPETFPLEILDLFLEDSRLLPYFDIPFQHANQDILKSMGRPVHKGTMMELIQGIRTKIPHAALRSSFITGYPGETQDQHQELVDALAQAELDWVGFFSYSREEGTRAYEIKPQVKAKDVVKRKSELERCQQEITYRLLDHRLNNQARTTMLVEEVLPGEPPIALGRCWFQAPEVDGLTVVPLPPANTKPGDWLEIELVSRSGVDMKARPV